MSNRRTVLFIIVLLTYGLTCAMAGYEAGQQHSPITVVASGVTCDEILEANK